MTKLTLLLAGAAVVLAQPADLVPLAPSNTWTLGNPYVSDTIRFSIVEDRMYGGVRAARMRFAAPWGTSDFLFNVENYGLSLDGIGLGGDNYRFGLPAAFLRYSASPGESWTHPLGSVTLSASGLSITTPAGTFTGVKRYALRGSSGPTQDWYLAPGVGFVQYGVGDALFQLRSYTLQPSNSSLSAPVRASTCPAIGIHANTAANVHETESAQVQRLDQAFAGGARLLHITYNWNEIEKTPGVYDLKDLQRQAAQANRLGSRIILTVRAIDANRRTLPADLMSRPLNDAAVQLRFREVVRAAVSAAGSRVQWINLANEVDMYLTNQQSEIAPFLQLYAAGAAAAKSVLPSVSVGVVFSHSNTRHYDAAFHAIEPAVSHVAFTYYHFADWRMKPLWVVSRDIAELAAWAKGKPLIFTEVGAPADPSLGSSPEYQASFYSAVFDALRLEGVKVAAVNFFLMSDPGAGTVQYLQNYYGLQNHAAFGAYLSTLGLFDRNGNARPAWTVFRERATQLNAGACTTY